MSDVVIAATARTPLCKSWREALNITHGATLGEKLAQTTRAFLAWRSVRSSRQSSSGPLRLNGVLS
jgi:hypothetical protein